ncbi:aminopeptidase P family protein [Achromobacter sp. SD115]|uniref:M24 family metallopeptidase n=1 Tax=Achromobacter sp. SD115 TaxID=2782011 RepID=UPI001A978D07|nr:Xaa-Pro peptidase family protein [Achromobacter sp. SD115]MBO1016094.1 aminopeptidase P family protein [Achromobacter sp. SD115]
MQSIDFQARRKRVAQHARELGFDAYLGTRQGALHYLSGAFMPWRGAVLVTADGHCEFIYWAMDASRVRAEGHQMEMYEFEFSDFPQLIRQRLEHHGLTRGKVALDLSHPGAAQVAPGMLTAAEYFDLTSHLPDIKFENGVDVIDDVMLIKDAAEIERLRHAAEVSDYGFEQGMNAVRAGATENEIAGEIERAIRRRGSTWSWAVTGGTEVGAGERTGFLRGVTQQATDRAIRPNEFVILDLHPLLDLYMADTALPVFLGKPDSAQSKLIDCWEETAQTMLASLTPGRPIAECASRGIAVFEKHGLSEFGLPLFGHGLGTCARTRPFINLRSRDLVTPGMVVALGTHLYRPGLGGMRLEYPVLIGEHGAEPLVRTEARVHRLP